MSSIRADILVAAKSEVAMLARAGKILTPKDAWYMSGHIKDSETLWSVAYRIAQRHDISAQELVRYLEERFPQYNKTDIGHKDWNDVIGPAS